MNKIEQLNAIMAEDIPLFMKYNKAARLVKTSIPKVITATGAPSYAAIRKQKATDPKTHVDMLAFFNHCKELAKQQEND